MKHLILTLALAMGVFAQEPAEPPKPQRRPPSPPKNLKILPAENLIPTMRAFTRALGVECNECHVQGDFASDENPKKNVARGMITMNKEINAKFPDGKMHVSCYTCHRGAKEPAMAPPAAEAPKAGF